eukprot:5781178-Pyramimonas_sp.AAC.2
MRTENELGAVVGPALAEPAHDGRVPVLAAATWLPRVPVLMAAPRGPLLMKGGVGLAALEHRKWALLGTLGRLT